MNLSEYVRRVGVSAFAKKFRVTERTARSYLYGARSPRTTVARRIAAGSSLTLDDIYSEHRKE